MSFSFLFFFFLNFFSTNFQGCICVLKRPAPFFYGLRNRTFESEDPCAILHREALFIRDVSFCRVSPFRSLQQESN